MAKTELLFSVPPVFDDTALLPDYSGITDHYLRIDLSDLRMMNSVGIKSWVQWTRQFADRNEVHLVNCPAAFLNIAAIVVGVIPSTAIIDSLLLRYISTEGDLELRGLFHRPANGEKWQLPEQIQDQANKKNYEFDGILTKSLGRLRSEIDVIPEIDLSRLQTLGVKILD